MLNWNPQTAFWHRRCYFQGIWRLNGQHRRYILCGSVGPKSKLVGVHAGWDVVFDVIYFETPATFLCFLWRDLSLISADVSFLPPWCKFFQSCSGGLVCRLVTWLKGSFFWSLLTLPFIQAFWLGDDVSCHWRCVFLKIEMNHLGARISEHLPVCALTTVR